jgi:hypothetical protein
MVAEVGIAFYELVVMFGDRDIPLALDNVSEIVFNVT